MNEIPSAPGTYILLGFINEESDFQVGKLGVVRLGVGRYVYCGSALGPGGLKARIQRHLKKEKKHFWHIDYLSQLFAIQETWLRIGMQRLECQICRTLQRHFLCQNPVSGFGSTDCRAGCKSHFLSIPNHVSVSVLDLFLDKFNFDRISIC